MRIDWSKEVEFIPPWNGNENLPETAQLKAKLHLLDVYEWVAVKEAIKEQAGDQPEGIFTPSFEQEKFLINQVGKYVEKHTKLTGNDNYTIEDVVKYPQFTTLAVLILFELIRVSAPKEQDVKN